MLMGASNVSFNVSHLLRENALRSPQKMATILENGESLTFSEMERACCQNVSLFKKSGIKSGDRVATFVRPGLDFVPVIFALFRLGAVPVFIDPGMSKSSMLQCIENSQCQAMVGIPLAHLLKKIKPCFFKDIKISICLTNSRFVCRILRAVQMEKASLKKLSEGDPFIEAVSPNQLATILFTSGSTGVPKGVEVSFGILMRQQQLLRETFGIADDEIDMVPFPLFALFSAAWGITSIIPAMNPAKPAKCSGKKLFNLMIRHQVTHSSGSPAIWKNVLEYCQTNNGSYKNLKRLLMAGAPVSEKLIKGWREILPTFGHVYTPYGATEALPLTFIADSELIADCFDKTRAGKGTCVGQPIHGTQIKIIKITEGPISSIEDIEELSEGAIGEIIVHSDVVTQKYFSKPEANRLAKISDAKNKMVWHRMGDLGYVDHKGRLWFCGRKDHRISTEIQTELYPDQLEAIFNQLCGVTRTALVGIPSSRWPSASTPVLMVEMKRQPKIEKLILLKALESEKTNLIKKVLFVKKFPTDVRHNIKINRQELSITAKNRIGIH